LVMPSEVPFQGSMVTGVLEPEPVEEEKLLLEWLRLPRDVTVLLATLNIFEPPLKRRSADIAADMVTALLSDGAILVVRRVLPER